MHAPLRSAGRLVIAFAALCAAACASSRELRLFAAEAELAADGGALDVEWTGDFAFAAVRVDGRGPVRFLVDTGASVVVVSPQLAERLGLERVPVNPESGGFALSGAQSTSAQVREVVPIRELRAGPLALRDVDAVVVDSDVLGALVGRPIDGVLPASAFRDFVVTFDAAARTVTVGRDPLPAPGEDPHVVELVPNALPQVTLTVAGATFPVLLDTGSSEFLSVPPGAAVPFRRPPVETGRYATIGGIVPQLQGRIDARVDWAGHVLENPVAGIASGARGGAGLQLLRNFRFTLDLPRSRARFERADATPLQCPPVIGIGAGFLRRADAWTVGYVIDGSPAARAGLAVGDRVVSVEGIPVADMPRNVYDALLSTGKPVRLAVAAPDGVRDVSVAAAALVE